MVGSLLIFASAGRRDLFRYIFLGAGAAVVLATGVGIAIWAVTRNTFKSSTPYLNSPSHDWFETGVFIVAVCVLTYMTFWMRRHSRSMGR